MTLSRRRRQRAVRLPRQPRVAQHGAGLQRDVAGVETALLRGPGHAYPFDAPCRTCSAIPRERGERPATRQCDDAPDRRGPATRRPGGTLFARYKARLRPALVVTEIAEARGAPAEIKRREAAALLAALPEAAFAVALDSGGEAPDSADLATLLERWLGLGRPLCFLIGGAEGLDDVGDRPRRLQAVARAH